MAGIPPLRTIRKTTALLVVVLLAFLVHRAVDYLITDDDIKDAGNTELSMAQGTVCRHIVKETPFGADSIFEEGSRLYFYTTVSSSLKNRKDTLWHVWYRGMDTVQVLPCNLKHDTESCFTEILPTKLTPGEWSVDLVLGRRLLYSRQFVIESSIR